MLSAYDIIYRLNDDNWLDYESLFIISATTTDASFGNVIGSVVYLIAIDKWVLLLDMHI